MKKFIGIRPCTLVYLLLIALSVLTWSVGISGLSGLITAMLVLALSMMKGFLIGDYYMGLKMVTSGWRWVVALWLLLPASLIAYAFYISTTVI